MRTYSFFPFPTLSGQQDPRTDPRNCPPPSGYSIYADSEMANSSLGNTIQAYTALPANTFPVDNGVYKELDSVQINSKSEALWLITVSAIETITVSREPIRYSNASRIFNSQNVNPPRYSIFQARASWSDGSARQNVVNFDIGGTTSFLVMARSVSIGILAPNPTYWLTSESPTINANVPELEGIVINAILSARIAPQVVPRTGCDAPKYTKRITTVDDEGALIPGFVEIPPAARKVRIYNCLDSATPSDMFFWISNDATIGYSQGIINFNDGDATNLLEIPAMATHIYTGENASNFTFVFLLDP